MDQGTNQNNNVNIANIGVPPIRQNDSVTPVVPWKYGVQQKIQAKRAKFSQINVKNPGTVSNIASATGTIGAGSTLFVIDTLTPQTPHGTEMNFAIPYLAVYEGTSAIPNKQIYPILGGSQSWGSYSFQNDLDWNTFATASPGSVISVNNLTIHNNMGAAGTFFYVSQYKYLNFNSGTVV